MAKKYRFKKEFSDSRIVLAGSGEEITKDNLTDELAERIIKIPRLAHNIEEVGAGDEEESEVKKLKAKISDLNKEIKDLKAENKALQKNAPSMSVSAPEEDQKEEPTDSSEDVNEGQNL
jgi:seryl-tRNA synthetase